MGSLIMKHNENASQLNGNTPHIHNKTTSAMDLSQQTIGKLQFVTSFHWLQKMDSSAIWLR